VAVHLKQNFRSSTFCSRSTYTNKRNRPAQYIEVDITRSLSIQCPQPQTFMLETTRWGGVDANFEFIQFCASFLTVWFNLRRDCPNHHGYVFSSSELLGISVIFSPMNPWNHPSSSSFPLSRAPARCLLLRKNSGRWHLQVREKTIISDVNWIIWVYICNADVT
jgi:hypothetical protein